jgi:hypothetical protein
MEQALMPRQISLSLNQLKIKTTLIKCASQKKIIKVATTRTTSQLPSTDFGQQRQALMQRLIIYSLPKCAYFCKIFGNSIHFLSACIRLKPQKECEKFFCKPQA